MGANSQRLNGTAPLGEEYADAWVLVPEEAKSLDQKLHLERQEARIMAGIEKFARMMGRR